MGIKFIFDEMDAFKVGDIPGLQEEDKDMLLTDRIKEVFNELELEDPDDVEIRIWIVSDRGDLMIMSDTLEGSDLDKAKIRKLRWYN